MRKIKWSLVVINEFQPFGLEVVGSLPDANRDWHETGTAREEMEENASGAGGYSLFMADASRVRGGYEYNSVMPGCWDHDKELYIYKNKVIWSGGQGVHKQFSAPTAVLQVRCTRYPCSFQLVQYCPSLMGCCCSELQKFHSIVSIGSCATPIKGLALSTIREGSRDGPFFGTGSRSSPFSHSSAGRRASLSSTAPPSLMASILALLHPQMGQGSCRSIKWRSKLYGRAVRFHIWCYITKVFLATDEDGIPILCLVVKEYQRLSTFRLSQRKISEELSSQASLEVAWSLKAISAAPIIALHPRRKNNQHFDLPFLSPDGNLSLHFLRAAELASQRSSSQQESISDLGGGCSDQGDEALKLLSIQDFVADRVNVLTSSGKVVHPWYYASVMIMVDLNTNLPRFYQIAH